MIKKKEVLSNYINVLNNFYGRLFAISHKLVAVEEADRKKELHRNLDKLFSKFQACQ